VKKVPPLIEILAEILPNIQLKDMYFLAYPVYYTIRKIKNYVIARRARNIIPIFINSADLVPTTSNATYWVKSNK